MELLSELLCKKEPAGYKKNYLNNYIDILKEQIGGGTIQLSTNPVVYYDNYKWNCKQSTSVNTIYRKK